MPARLSAFLQALVLAFASGFPAYVNTLCGCLPSCRRNTAAANLGPGQSLTLGNPVGGSAVLGYEWDVDLDNPTAPNGGPAARPAGLFDLSSTTLSNVDAILDYGSTTGPATLTHHLTTYRMPSGALVFGAGTVQWSWGLDVNHDTNPDTGPTTPDVNMQQATVNILADMAAQPGSLQPGLVLATRSTDTTAPTSRITTPANGSSVAKGASVTVTGTAADTGGGIVGGVEVSVDSGITWHPANGTTSWSYAFTASQGGPWTIKSRAVDDSGNLETPSAGNTLTVTGDTSPPVISNIATSAMR